MGLDQTGWKRLRLPEVCIGAATDLSRIPIVLDLISQTLQQETRAGIAKPIRLDSIQVLKDRL